MTILSDRQITALCVAPTHKLDENKYDNLPERFISDTLHRSPSWAAQHAAEREQGFRDQCMVELTDDERAAFSPMITPFHPELVRIVETGCFHEALYNQWIGHFTRNGREPSEDERRQATIKATEKGTRKIISKGLSSFGYDITLSNEIQIFTNAHCGVINPKQMDMRCMIAPQIQESKDGQYILLPPNSYLLGYSVEHFHFPRDVTGLFIGKSTYARAGLIVNCTPGEAGWQGQLVIEAGNLTSLPIMVYINEGIAQCLFLKGDEDCLTSYADRGGKYQGQSGLTHAKV